MEYLAHISDDKTRKQTVLEHSQNVAMLAKQYADVFEAGSWGYCCGETHDIGKYSDEFQERLKGGKLVDHATASACTWRYVFTSCIYYSRSPCRVTR